MLRRRDFSLVGGRLRLTTPTGSPSEELFESDPQSVTDSGDMAPRSAPVAAVRDEVDELEPPSLTSLTVDSSPVAAAVAESPRTSIIEGSARRKR